MEKKEKWGKCSLSTNIVTAVIRKNVTKETVLNIGWPKFQKLCCERHKTKKTKQSHCKHARFYPRISLLNSQWNRSTYSRNSYGYIFIIPYGNIVPYGPKIATLDGKPTAKQHYLTKGASCIITYQTDHDSLEQINMEQFQIWNKSPWL